MITNKKKENKRLKELELNKNYNYNTNNNLNKNSIIKTYIKGFDELIKGGFPKGSNILLSGTYGTGKTIFSLEYIYNGAIYDNENGLYITFEEKKESLIEQAKQFEWDFKKEEEKGRIKIISIGIEDISKHTVDEILDIIKNSNIKRCVIDSITTLSLITPENNNLEINKYSIKKFLYSFITKFNQNKEITTLFISQNNEKESDLISKYLCDGVIELSPNSLGGDYSRTIRITKLRKVKNNDGIHSLEINKKYGIIIHEI